MPNRSSEIFVKSNSKVSSVGRTLEDAGDQIYYSLGFFDRTILVSVCVCCYLVVLFSDQYQPNHPYGEKCVGEYFVEWWHRHEP